MFEQATRSALNELVPINDTMKISYPITYVHSDNIGAELNLEIYENTPFNPFAVYNFSELYAALNIVDNAKITLQDNIILAKSETVSIKYKLTALSIIQDEVRILHYISDLKKENKIGSFDLSKENLVKIIKGSGFMQDLINLNLEMKDELKISVSKDNISSNDYHFYIPSNLPSDFKKTISLEIINKLPRVDYNIDVYNKVLILSTVSIPGLTIYMKYEN